MPKKLHNCGHKAPTMGYFWQKVNPCTILTHHRAVPVPVGNCGLKLDSTEVPTKLKAGIASTTLPAKTFMDERLRLSDESTTPKYYLGGMRKIKRRRSYDHSTSQRHQP
jgi:hypothetical protein